MAAETYRIEIPIEVQDKTEPGASNAQRKVNKFDESLDKTKKKLDAFNKTKFSVALEAVDKATAVIERVGSTVRGIASKVWSVTMKVVDTATAPIRGIINLLRNPILQAGAIIGVSVSLKDTIDTFSTFEATMSKVQAVGEMTADQIAVVTQKAKEMGATTKFTATEAGEAFTYMAQAGWETEQMLAGIEGVLALSSADGLDLASTASIVTDTLAAFGLQASDTARFADVLAKAAAATNVDVAQMGETFKYVAPVAGAMGYSIEDMSTAIGLMANASVKGSMAGTALKTAISNMVTPTDEQIELMNQLGISMTDSAGNANTFMTVMTDLRKGFSRLSETEKTATAATLFGREAMSGMLAIMNASEDSFNSLSEAIANSEGTAQQMSEVMLDNVAGSLTLLQSAADGVKIAFGSRLAPYLRQFATWLTGKMPGIEKGLDELMDSVDLKIEWLKTTIADFTSGEDWENADIWGKIKIAWDSIVAEPFSTWWSNTGKQFFIEKATSLGEGIGSGIKTGLLAMLGIDVSDTLEEGKSVGSSFISGFKEGFNTEEITAALKTWAENNKEIVAGLGIVLGGKLIGGIYKGVKEARSLYSDLKGLLGKGSGNTAPSVTPSSYATTTMTVTANVVNVYGTTVNQPGNGLGNAAKNLLLPAAGGAAGTGLAIGGGKAVAGLLTAGGAATAPLLLPGATGAAGTAATAAGGLTAAGSWLSKLLTLGSTSSVIGANGTLLSVSGGVGGTLGSVGGALGTTATTAAGAAAAGAAGTGGIIGGILGLGSAIIDLFQGIGKGKEGDTKGAKDEYVTAGTKAGMVGAGAGVGAAIGSVVPGIGTAIGALVGAGVGGIGALLGGDKAGKAISDSTDEGGGLSKAWEWTKNAASDAAGWVKTAWSDTGSWLGTNVWEPVKGAASAAGEWIAGAWDTAKGGVETAWASVSGWFDTNVWTPVKDVGISAINIAVGIWETAKEGISEAWSSFSGWFDESVWTPVSEAASAAGEWIGTAWSDTKSWVTEAWSDFSGWFNDNIWTPVGEAATSAGEWISTAWSDAKTWITDTWTDFSGWFSTNIWEPVKGAAETAGAWVSERWGEAKNAVGEAWTSFSGWFDTTVWEPVKGAAATAGEWISSRYTEAKDAVATAWEAVSGWFDTNIWSPVKEGAATAGTWISTKYTEAKDALQTAWTGVSGWFESNVWGPIRTAASSAANWVREKWEAAKGWLSGIADKGSASTGLTTSGGGSSVITPHATGGILTQPHMGLVAEAGPEAIIPLTPSKRTRGIDLWREAGAMMGVQPYEDGGIVGEETPDDFPIATRNGGGVSVKIEVTANPEFTVTGGGGVDDERILAVLKEYIRSMADDISDEIAERLARVFANMPVRATP